MTKQFIYTMSALSRHFPPDKQVLQDVNLSFYPGAKIGIVGSNGSGKSTLLRIMAGLDDGFVCSARLTPGFTVGLLAQEPQLDNSRNVTENISDGVLETTKLIDEYNSICDQLGDADADFDTLLARQSDLQDKLDAQNAWEIDRKIEIAMDALRVPPGDQNVADLSGGERRRVALCRLLLSAPDLLLLDEPTNHLDAQSVAWLEKFLENYPGTVVTITHDRYFLDNVAGWILELDRGRAIPWEGNYSSWLEQKQARFDREEKIDKARQQTIARELEWIKMAPRARHAKSKARVNEYQRLLAEAESADRTKSPLSMSIAFTQRLGDVVIQANNLVKGFNNKLLMENLSFSVPKGAVVGVVGANGAGKTTLFKMITGSDKPDDGELIVGNTVDLAYVDQSRDALQGDNTVYQEITDGRDEITIGKQVMNSRAYVAGFNFRGSDQQKLVSTLSGGERNRVHLAKVLRTGGNVLLLDEPSNDLDVDTLRSLEDAIMAFPGCTMVTSHDRWFLDRIATHILSFEGNSQVVWFDGNYSEYEKSYMFRVGNEGRQPHRIKYKPLAR